MVRSATSRLTLKVVLYFFRSEQQNREKIAINLKHIKTDWRRKKETSTKIIGEIVSALISTPTVQGRNEHEQKRRLFSVCFSLLFPSR